MQTVSGRVDAAIENDGRLGENLAHHGLVGALLHEAAFLQDFEGVTHGVTLVNLTIDHTRITLSFSVEWWMQFELRPLSAEMLCAATPRATVPLPAPDGPSIAIISGLESLITNH